MIVREVFPNGVRLITEQMDHVRSVSVGVWLTRGSRHEPQEHGGIAHLVEHMLYKGNETSSEEECAELEPRVSARLRGDTHPQRQCHSQATCRRRHLAHLTAS